MCPCDISGSRRFISEVLRTGTQAICLTACVALLVSVVKLHLPVSLQPPDLTHVMVKTKNDCPNQQNKVENSCTNGLYPHIQQCTKPNKLNKHIYQNYLIDVIVHTPSCL